MDRRKIIYMDDAIDALCKSECGWNNAECRHKNDTDFCVTCDNVKIIKSLPSAQPDLQPTCNQLATDCISRQQSIDALRTMQTYKLFSGDDMILIDKAEVQAELMMLPSAQPERKDALEKAVAAEAISDELMSRFDISATYGYDFAEAVMNRIEAMAKELERGEQE